MNRSLGHDDVDAGLGNRRGAIIRCAVYTRKSSEEGLDMAFNSLDAQREAGSDYIKSQKHQGWTLVPGHYDDGGYSGGTTERPGLQRLLEDIKRGKVDVVVVYKVDRLSRSLTDFAKLMQTFDEHNVSFVSVTQQFNTTTSMGRLTLNMLLSFAQFEREVAGERIRDKIAATKRKGVWVCGQPPLGYRMPREGDAGYVPGDRVLRVVESEAKLVRAIYTGYLELGSLVKLASRLNNQGYTTKRWVSSRNRDHGGRPLSAAFLHRVLTNPVYTGHITHSPGSGKPGTGKDNRANVQVFPGQHQPIIDQATWDQVRAKMNVANREERQRWTHTHLLKGKLRTFEDHAMSPGSVQRPQEGKAPGEQRRVRYYVSQKAIKQGYASCPIKSMNGEFLDDLVRAVVLKHLATGHGLDLSHVDVAGRDRWVREFIRQVVIAPEELIIDLALTQLGKCKQEVAPARGRASAAAVRSKRSRPVVTAEVPSCALRPRIERGQDGQTVRLVLQVRALRSGRRRMLVGPDGNQVLTRVDSGGRTNSQRVIIEAIGQAFAWHRELLQSGATIESLAHANGVTSPWVHRMLWLTHLSPPLLGKALAGPFGSSTAVADLIQMGQQVRWTCQARLLKAT